MTRHYTGYTPNEGFLLPLGHVTNMDWRNVPYLSVYVDKYIVDGDIPDLSAPAAVRAAADPVPAADIKATPIAKWIWRLSSGTTLFEFDDRREIRTPSSIPKAISSGFGVYLSLPEGTVIIFGKKKFARGIFRSVLRGRSSLRDAEPPKKVCRSSCRKDARQATV
jgi:hypothetical protein